MNDVVIAGGGPAGSVCAARLAAHGRRVVVLERERHPRFHLGESLLPNSLGVLEAIGILDAVRARFLVESEAHQLIDGHELTRVPRSPQRDGHPRGVEHPPDGQREDSRPVSFVRVPFKEPDRLQVLLESRR